MCLNLWLLSVRLHIHPARRCATLGRWTRRRYLHLGARGALKQSCILRNLGVYAMIVATQCDLTDRGGGGEGVCKEGAGVSEPLVIVREWD